MQDIFLKATLGLGILVLAASHAQAAQNCAPRERVVDTLRDRYGETRQSIGLGAQGAVVEMFASVQSGTWTIVVTTPGGVSCLIASGQAFEALAEAAAPGGNDT